MKKLLISLAALFAVTTAFAIPTMFGATGGLRIENGKIADKITVGSYFYQLNKFIPAVSLTVPAAAVTGTEDSVLNNFEFSFAYQHHYNDASDDYTFGFGPVAAVGAKYALPLEYENLSIAVGGNYVDRQVAIFTEDGYYEMSNNFNKYPLERKVYYENKIYASGTYSVDSLGLDLTLQASYGFNSKNPYLNANIEKDFGKFAVGFEYDNAFAACNVYITSDKLINGVGLTAGFVKGFEITDDKPNRPYQLFAGAYFSF